MRGRQGRVEWGQDGGERVASAQRGSGRGGPQVEGRAGAWGPLMTAWWWCFFGGGTRIFGEPGVLVGESGVLVGESGVFGG